MLAIKKVSVPGCIIINAPTKPTKTPSHLLNPTISPRKITDRITTNNGAVWKIAIVAAKDKLAKPAKIKMVAPKSRADLKR